MLLLADRGFRGYAQWSMARATGADLLWRSPNNLILPELQALDDGSYLSALYPNDKARQAGMEGVLVRVIEYTMPKLEGAESSYRLITSLLDPVVAPAKDMAALYHTRWQVESVFDELKTHLLHQRRVFRSKTAELVRQEFYGWVLAHYAVRWLMHQAASEYRLAHADLSFTAHVHLIRRTQPQSGAFPPRSTKKAKPVVS